MILAVNLNPSVDRVWTIPRFAAGATHAVTGVWLGAGGKGGNVARVCAQLGAKVAVTGFVAGSAGTFIEAHLARAGVTPFFYRLASGETRTCPTIIDPISGRVTEIREPGPAVSPADAQAFEEYFLSLLKQLGELTVVTLSGSLPPGPRPDFYARLIRSAASFGLRSILDASGEALREGVKARPWAVKVNHHELLELAPAPSSGGPEASLSDDVEERLAARLRGLVEGGVGLAVVTRGLEGLLAFDGETLWKACPPRDLQAISTVGSGDAATAALACWASRNPGAGERAALLADMVAAGAANAVSEGIGNCPPELFAALRPRVDVRVLRRRG